MSEERRAAHRLAEYMLMLPEDFSWYTGMELTAVKFKKQDEGWLLIVGAKNGKHAKVSFWGGSTIPDAMRTFYVAMRDGAISWRKDKYA